jgi:hypothetical protein
VRGPRFEMEINGLRCADRPSAAARLLDYYKQAERVSKSLTKGDKHEERLIGRYAGLALVLSMRSGYSPSLELRNRRSYRVEWSDTAVDLVREIENAAAGMDGGLARARQSLARSEKRLADIQSELSKPFEKEDRLTELLIRQREIDAALDLDRNEAEGMDAECEAA